MTPPKTLRCPGCENSSAIISRGKRDAVYPSGCLALIGPLLASLHQASSPVDYECGACGRKFSIRSAAAKFCMAIIALLALWMVIGFFGALFIRE